MENYKESIEEMLMQAENGSAVAQLQAGKHFLKLAESSDEKREENAEAALKWLILSSKQGNEEATEKLKHCLDTKLDGIDKYKDDIKWCLNTSSSERKIRQAARSLFSQINNAQATALSKEEYVNAINKITAGHERERKILLAAGKKIGKTITENDFVKTLSKKIQGTLTLTAEEMDDKSAAYESSGFLKKVFLHPRQTAAVVFDQCLEMASKEGMNVVMALIPTNQIYLLAMLFIYSFMTPQFVLFVVPLLVFYLTLLVMVICTLQMFYKRRKQRDAATLATLLQQKFDMAIDIETTKSQYSWNSLTPYIIFFCALPLLVISFSLSNKAYIPSSAFFVVSLIMTGFCFIALADSHDVITFLAIGSHFIASLPVFLTGLPNLPGVSDVVNMITVPFFQIELLGGIFFNLSVPSVVYLLIPLLFLRMAVKGSWSGLHRILIPHLVCYFWFSLASTIYPFTTLFGMARAALGYMLLPVLIPAGAVAAFLGIFYGFYLLLQTEMIGKVIVTVLLLLISLLLAQTQTLFGGKSKDKDKKEKKDKKKGSGKLQKIIMILLAVSSVLPLLFIHVPGVAKKTVSEISFEDFHSLCVPPPDDLTAPYEIRCQDFLGWKVNWTGSVTDIKLLNIENTARNVLNSLPNVLSNPLLCTYGDEYPVCDESTMSEKSFKHCQLIQQSGRECHLNKHNKVSLSLVVAVQDLVVTAEAGAAKTLTLMALQKGDEVQFSGSLVAVGTTKPVIKLKSIQCLNRELAVMAHVETLDEEDIMELLNNAFSLVLHFALFPVLSYSTV